MNERIKKMLGEVSEDAALNVTLTGRGFCLEFDTAIWYEFADLEEDQDYEGQFQREYMSTRADEPLDLNLWLEQCRGSLTA